MIKRKRVLILGGLGFIGKNLFLSLVKEGHSVFIVADSIDRNDSFVTPFVLESIQSGSILDKDFMEQAVKGFDVIFSLAGRSGASDSIADPYTDLDRNLKGHLNILEACRKVNPDGLLVFPSSRLVYGKPQTNPVNEQHELNPESIYAVHKLTVEYYYRLYARLYGLKCIIFRIGNPYGPHQRFGSNHYGILNWFVHKALHGEPIEIYGDGSQKRDFIHIQDLVNALVLAMNTPALYGGTYNLGYGKGISLREAAEIIHKFVPKTIVNFKPWPEIDSKIETGDYISDISKFTQATQWQPTIDFETGIQNTITFYESAKRA